MESNIVMSGGKEETKSDFHIRLEEVLRRSDTRSAHCMIDEALKKNPHEPELHLLKANVFCEEDKFDEAIMYLSQAPSGDTEVIKRKIEWIAKEKQLDDPPNIDLKEKMQMKDFLDWMKNKGAIFSKIKIRHYGKNYRGVHAKGKIFAGERVLTIPADLILTESKGFVGTSLGAKIKKSGVRIDYPYCTYIGCLFFESASKASQKFKPYLDIFPSDASAFPFCYTKDEWAQLETLSFKNHVEKERNDWLAEYQRICKAVPEFTAIKFEDYLTASVLLCSRNFYCHNAPEPRLVVPLADMFNHLMHKTDQTLWQYVSEERAFVVSAKQDIEIGEEIGVNYGAKASSRFLHYYGFIPEYNTYESVPLQISFNMDDPLLKDKQKLLDCATIEVRNLQFFPEAEYFTYSNEKTLSYLRFVEYSGDLSVVTPSIIEKSGPSARKRKIALQKISLENERKVLIKLKSLANGCLKRYANTIEEDKSVLEKKKDLSYNLANIIKVRIIERRLYEKIVLYANKALDVLNLSYEEAKLQDKHMTEKTWLNRYIETSLLPLLGKKTHS